MPKAKNSSSMRDALKGKTRRRETYHLVLTDPTGAQKALTEAEAGLRLAKLRHEPDDPAKAASLTAAQAAVDDARAALMEHVLPITFEQIPPYEWEQLRAAHAPSAKQTAEHTAAVAKAKKDGTEPPSAPEFDPDALVPALFARTVVPADGEECMTVDEWADVLREDGDWSRAEVGDAFNTCLTAILEPRSVVIPFD